jgi:ferritin
MIETKIAKLINDQIEKEWYSAYLYLDFANYFEAEGLDGFAHWYEIQAQEERDHAMMLRRYLINNAIKVTFEAVPKPEQKYSKPEEVLAEGYKHEQFVTSQINKIYEQAFTIKDFKTMQFLDWFIKEQGEEEKNAEDLIKKFELYGHDAKGLYSLNQELNARVYTQSASAPQM